MTASESNTGEQRGFNDIITDGEHAALLFDFHCTRSFDQCSIEGNTIYTSEMCQWIAANFSYLTYGHSKEFSCSELPNELRTFTTTFWEPGGELHIVDPNDTSVSMSREEVMFDNPSAAHSRVRSLFRASKTIEEFKSKYAEVVNEADAAERAELAELSRITRKYLIINWFYPRTRQSGLEFIVPEQPDEAIRLNIFGDAQTTRKFVNFLNMYHDNQQTISKVASTLAVLGAKHCLERSSGLTMTRHKVAKFLNKLDSLD